MVVVHLLTSFAAEFYQTETCLGNMYCDNISALNQALHVQQRVRTGSKHSDLLPALCFIKAHCLMTFCYSYVHAHQDKYVSWRALMLIKQLNVTCNTLAVQAITHGMMVVKPSPKLPFLLPREHVAVIFHREKLVSNVSVKVQHLLGKEEACRFFTAWICICK